MIKKFLTSRTSIAPLAVFRALFGFIMLASIIRFAAKGWIYELYVQPEYYFTYFGFGWVTSLGEFGMYALFGLMALGAAGIMLGYRYRIAAVLFFLSFTYVELIDKTNYLNHYYFVSIISFLLILVPAHRCFSLDVRRKSSLYLQKVPAWTVNIFKLQLGIVYFYAGLAKLNADWLLNAMPMKLWLPAHTGLPIIGELLQYEATAFLFSWAGAAYDLSIVFLLLYRPTRGFAYAAVVVFHLLTAALFPIGMFPYIMILSTLIYFSSEFHEALIKGCREWWARLCGRDSSINPKEETSCYSLSKMASGALTVILVIHFGLQLLLPFRFALYPGDLLWNEQGYRFSWRVMLMEKAGHATFNIYNPETDRRWQASNYEHLTRRQEKMMATQPDMILQFAHHLETYYREQGMGNVEITAQTHVTLNGRMGRPLVDPAIDLAEIERGLSQKNWILPYEENQKSWLGNR
jgi:hypothetical protein